MVEVAQFTFTPAAGAVLADWGADVIKVEHAFTGDAQRGLQLGTGGVAAGSFQPLMEHPNRGKRSIGLALENPERPRGAARPRARSRRLPHQLPARRATPPEARGRGHPRGQPQHHLRAGQRPRPARPGRREGRLRRLDLLVPHRQRVVGDAVRQPPRHRPAGRCLRRLDRRHDDRRWNRRRAVRARAHRRAVGGRRVAAERRRVDDGAQPQQRDAHR